MNQELSAVNKGDAVLSRPCLGIGHLKRSVAVWLQHFRADHDRHRPCCTCETDGQLGVALPSLEAMLGFATHRNVTRRPEFLTKRGNGLCLVCSFTQHLLGQFCETSRGERTVAVRDAGEGLAMVDREGER